MGRSQSSLYWNHTGYLPAHQVTNQLSIANLMQLLLPSYSINCSSTLSFPQSLPSCFRKLWGWIQLSMRLPTGLLDMIQDSWDTYDLLQWYLLGRLQGWLKWPLNAFGWAPVPHILLPPRPPLQFFLLQPSDWVAAILDSVVHEFLWSVSAPGIYPACPVVKGVKWGQRIKTV